MSIVRKQNNFQPNKINGNVPRYVCWININSSETGVYVLKSTLATTLSEQILVNYMSQFIIIFTTLIKMLSIHTFNPQLNSIFSFCQVQPTSYIHSRYKQVSQSNTHHALESNQKTNQTYD